jgi:hypothetical protein
VALTGSTMTADILKKGHIKKDSDKIKITLANLGPMDKVVNKFISELHANMSDMLKLAANDSSIKIWIQDTDQVIKWIKMTTGCVRFTMTGRSVGYGSDYKVKVLIF